MATRKDEGGAAAYARRLGADNHRWALDLLAENVRLRDRLMALQAEMEQQSRKYSEEYVEVEKRNNTLLNLYVATYRLHGTIDRAEVVESIRDIVANLVGCEEQALFEMEDGRLRLVDFVGIDPDKWREVSLGQGPVGQAAQSGDIYVAEQPATDDVSPTACVPLKLNGEVTGAIALFRMLPQKPVLEESDTELFDLLVTHAATALYCTRKTAELVR
jgi:hypothetical protein